MKYFATFAVFIFISSSLPVRAACPGSVNIVDPSVWPAYYQFNGSGSGAAVTYKAEPSGAASNVGTVASQLQKWEKDWRTCQAKAWPESIYEDSPRIDINCAKIRVYESYINALKCHASVKGTGGADERTQNIDAELDTVTPQVRGCPKYLRKSLVVWRQVGNPQLNTWEIRNRSDKTLSVTYRDSDGVNGDTNGLGPGGTSSVSLVSRVIPPYVVRDFDELFAFNKTPAARAGKTLKCQLAIRPR